MIVERKRLPLLSRGGADRDIGRSREASLIGAVWVVLVKKSLANTTPSARNKVASHLYLMAQQTLLG